MKILRKIGAGAGTSIFLVIALIGTPALIALGLMLLGVPLDWSNWKTYAGIVSLAAAMVWANL